ncbi:MADS box transcription factor [Striga asiatica]|uniref:MADS box transcription factor n=1 Tax=Striga asiatica TaxID=4170 RepID=A0A5A7RH65_STRAF|nr:MADS box transcription factor [Striga asiatica]
MLLLACKVCAIHCLSRNIVRSNAFSDQNHCFVRATIDRYKKASADSSNSVSTSEANTQFYQQEANKLRRQIREIQDLRGTETKIEKAIARIRTKKELELHNANMFLRAKIAESERAKELQMNLMPSGSEYQQQPTITSSQSYDVRNFLPMNNLMETNHHYSPDDETALQLLIEGEFCFGFGTQIPDGRSDVLMINLYFLN